MKLNCNSFFDGKFEYLNLNDFYLQNKKLISNTKRPNQIQKVLNSLKKNTFGGYGEDRKDVWAGTYMDETQAYIHLGIDINVPVGTPVRCPFDAYIVESFTDTDTKIGWGGRLTLTTDTCEGSPPFLILAHLDPTSMVAGDTDIVEGSIIGKVGTWPTNGNTFQHLHVQVMMKLTENYDGYGLMKDLENSPNPFTFDFL